MAIPGSTLRSTGTCVGRFVVNKNLTVDTAAVTGGGISRVGPLTLEDSAAARR